MVKETEDLGTAPGLDRSEQTHDQKRDDSEQNPFEIYRTIVIANGKYERTMRLLDILFSFINIVLLLPIGLLIALAIRIDSPGPILIRQKRIGRNRRAELNANGKAVERRKKDTFGEPFYILKFRTMYSTASLYEKTPGSDEDVRVTKVGRFLRQLGLDELPQLLNALKGDMSIVGPRPEMPFLVEKYSRLEACRLLVKPGITGYWQINAPRDRHIHEVLHYDLYYIKNRGLRLDFLIMLKTVAYMFSMKNK